MSTKTRRTPTAAAAALATLLALALAPARAPAQAYGELTDDVKETVEVSAPEVALVGVRVIDGTGAPAAEDRTVLLRGGRIAAVGPSAEVDVPEGAKRIELDGHTVIPGLVGLHNHSFYTTSERKVQSSFSAPRLYLAGGVTTVRTTGAIAPYDELNLRSSVQAGEAPGPRMVVTGPYISGGEDEALSRVRATSPGQARRVVDYWTSEGVEWFKFYTGVSRGAMAAAVEAGHERGARFTGHLCSVTFREAVERGIDNLEHGFLTNTGWVEGKEPDRCPSAEKRYASLRRVKIDGSEVRATIRAMVENDVALTTTPAVYELFVPGRPPLRQRTLSAMAPAAREEYLASREELAENPDAAIAEELLLKSLAFDRAFFEAGGLLAAGVDPTGNGGALFGYGDQRNYELLREGGFSPAEAVRVMTLNGARVLGMEDEVGSVESGKRADLVVLEGDPADPASGIRDVRLVFKEGVGYDPDALAAAVEGQVGIR